MNTMRKRSIVIGAAASLAFTAALSAVTSASVSALESRNRFWGQNRYDTAADICKNAWTASDYAVIVRGDEFADALCAAPLAQKFNAPILLTEKDSLNAKTKDELNRLKVKHIIIVGGTGAISQNVESQLNAIAPSERIKGTDRYDTSINIAAKLGPSGTVVLATGENYADAISIAPIAAMKNMPIILVPNSGLTEAQKNYLSNNNIKKTYVVGGKSVINDEILKQVHGGIRLGGSNRYGTNARIIDEFKDELNFDNIYAVIGEGSKKDGFADALSGAPLAAKNSSPVILTNKSVPSEIGQEISSIKGELSPKIAVTAFGGEAVVPDKVIDEIKKDAAVTYEDYKNTGSPASITNSVRINEKDAEFENTTVAGNVYIYGDNAKLTNITVKGILFIDPGENGTTHLENVKADEIKLRSGGSSSIHIKGVTTNNFEVESYDSDRSVRIVAEGTNDIKSTIIRSNAVLDASSGSIGDILIDQSSLNNKNIELSGNFSSAVIVKAAASIKIDGGAQVSRIELPEDAPGSGVNLTGTGEVQDIQVKNNTAKVSVPEGYKVTGKIEAVDKGCIDTKDSSLSSKVEVKDPGSMTGSQGVIPVGSIPRQDYAPAFTSMSLKSASGKAANASITSDTIYLNIPESIQDDDKFTDGNIVVSEVLSKVTFNQSLSYEPSGGVTSENLTSFIKSHEIGGDGISKLSIKKYDGTTITITDMSGKSTTYTLRVLTTSVEMINNGQNVPENAEINASGAYGPSTGTASVSGNLKLSADGISLSNVNINGTLTVDPGDNGTVYLKNITADKIEVLSGALNSVHMDGVRADILDVSQDDTVRIVANNSTKIKATNMKSGGELETADGVQSTFGSVEISSAKDVRLQGNLGTSEINVSGKGNVSINDNSSVGNIRLTAEGATLNLGTGAAAGSVDAAGSSASINFGQNSAADAVNVSGSDARLNLGDGASVGAVTSSAQNTSVNVNGTDAFVGNINVSEGASNAVVSVGENAKVETVNANAETTINGNGIVGKINKGSEAAIKVEGCDIKSDGTAETASSIGLMFALSNADVKTINLTAGTYIIAQSEVKCDLTIKGNNDVCIKTLSPAFFTVRKGAALTLDGVVLDGNYTAVCGIYKEDKNSIINVDESKIVKANNKILTYESIESAVTGIKIDENFDPNKLCNIISEISVIPDENLRNDLISKLNTEVKAKFIEVVRGIVAAVPKAEQITKLSEIADAKQKLSLAYKMIDEAKVNVKASDSDFNLTSLKATEAKLKLCDAAVKALSMVPQASSVNISNLASAKSLAAAADIAIEKSGITDFDTVNLNNVKNKITAIDFANTALSAVPTADSITKVNYKVVEAKISAADIAVNAALKNGAVRTDLIGLDRFEAAKLKVAEIEKSESDKTEAVDKANDAIAQIPSGITVDNIEDAQAKVIAAEDLVNKARALGASDADFINLDKIEKANAEIKKVKESNGVKELILKANEAISKVPGKDDINKDNLVSAKELIKAADDAIRAARLKGAVDTDFAGVDKLEAARAKVTGIDAANAAISAVTEADLINKYNLNDARSEVKAADDAIANAKAKGAKDTDFDGLDKLEAARAKVGKYDKAFEALAQIPDAKDITYDEEENVQERINNAESLIKAAEDSGARPEEFASDRLEAANAKIAEIELVKADKNALNVSYDGTSEYIVLSDKGSNGTVITWSDDPENIINTGSGTVLRPQDEDKDVTLTATITKDIYKDGIIKDSIVTTKTFTIKVKKFGVDINVSTTGKQVTIKVENSEMNGQDVTISLYNKQSGNLAYIQQGKIADGNVTFQTEIEPGIYYGYVNTARGQFRIHEFKVIDAVVTVKVQDNTFTIDISTGSEATGDVTLQVVDEKGNVKDFGQQTLADGKCEFKGELPNGVYTAMLRVPGTEDIISTDKFTIDVPDSVIVTASVNSGTVTISVNCLNVVDGTYITLKITTKDGETVKSLDQGKIMNGTYVYQTQLDPGEYTGIVKVTGFDQVIIPIFTVNP